MGLGVYVKCKKCSTCYDLSIGYGGINDYHEFVCFSCKSIFCKSVEHQDVDFHSIGVEVFSKEAVQIEDNFLTVTLEIRQ